MNLLQSELIEHKKILDAFQDLPKDIKKYILTFHNSTNAVVICPQCYLGSYRVLIYEHECFICEHNYYKAIFPLQNKCLKAVAHRSPSYSR